MGVHTDKTTESMLRKFDDNKVYRKTPLFVRILKQFHLFVR